MVIRTKNQDTLVLGLWNMICDRCGRKFKNVDIREEWNGLMVCRSCWEPRHPQDFLKGVKDDQSVPYTRPDSSSHGCGPNNVSGFAISGCAISGNILSNIQSL